MKIKISNIIETIRLAAPNITEDSRKRKTELTKNEYNYLNKRKKIFWKFSNKKWRFLLITEIQTYGGSC